MRPDPFAWQLHPDALAGLAVLAALYALALRRFPASRGRVAAFAAGIALLVATAVSPLDSLTFHLLTAHLLQNVVLAEWAPALLVVGTPPALAGALARVRAFRVLTAPYVALPLWLAVYALWHLPPAYDAALRHPGTLLHLEHLCFLAAGILVWWPVFHRRPHALPPGLQAGYLFAAFVLASPIGLLIALVPDPIYGFYEGGFAPWGLTALEDQRLAGVTMAAEEAVVFFALFVRAFARFLGEEDGDGAAVGPGGSSGARTGREARMSGRDRRVAENEAVFRRANEELEESFRRIDPDTDVWPFLCECGSAACRDVIRLTPGEYARVRASPHTFAVVPGHELPGVEDVVTQRIVDENDRFAVVEKRGAAREVTGAADPGA